MNLPAAWDEWPSESFLGGLSSHAREVLMNRGVERDFQRGARLCHEGEASTHVLVLLAGVAKASVTVASGYEHILRFIKPGEAVGIESALDSQTRSTTVQALQPCRTLILPGERFRNFLESHPEAHLALLKEITGNLREATHRQAIQASSTTGERLASALIMLASDFGTPGPDGEVHVSIPLSQQELASLIGTSREGVARALRQLRVHGLIRTSYRGTSILDMPSLQAVAHGGR